MNDCKAYKVIIFGQEYTLTTDESELHILKAAESVDSLMRSIADKSKLRDGQKIAVLAALRLSTALFALEQQLQKREDNEKKLIAVIDSELSSVVTAALAHGTCE